jgi:hypothetical protein
MPFLGVVPWWYGLTCFGFQKEIDSTNLFSHVIAGASDRLRRSADAVTTKLKRMLADCVPDLSDVVCSHACLTHFD